MDDRGTGRTSRQLAALPDGSIFIVPHSPMAKHCQHLLFDAGRAHDAVRMVVVSTSGDADRLRGIRRGTPWAIDHAFHTCAGPWARRAIAEIELILSR